MSALATGDTVECRLYNSVERKFYGEYWRGVIVDIDASHLTGITVTPYLVKRQGEGYHPDIWLKRNEIKRRV